MQSLAQPGGQITGFTNFDVATISQQWLEMLKQVAPGAKRVAILFHPDLYPVLPWRPSIERAATLLALEPSATPVRTTRELEQGLATFARDPNGALLVLPDTSMVAQRASIVALAATHRLPAMYPFRHFVQHGGLLGYNVDGIDLCRQAAGYADRILRGASAGELPVQAPTKYELIINRKTAKTLGLTVPATLLARADQVID